LGAGNYTFTINSADELLHFWWGDTAYSGWTRANAKTYVNSGGSFSASLPGDRYIPLRIMWANAQGDFATSWTLTAPNGTVLVNANNQASSRLITTDCMGAAPAYANFGSET
jgi:hypothetical protein